MLNLPGYTLTEPLHEGSVTILYRGYRSADQTPVVIKLLKGDYPTEREIARLQNEYLITHDLDAPGIVKAYSLLKSSAGVALILEDAGGRPLSAELRSRRLDIREALSIASSLAAAVGEIHDHHIIHRDIKPHNVLVDMETFAVKLIDFGSAARLLEDEAWEARPDALAGTLAYMSPEQTGRLSRAVDHRTDLYSLGVTLYEMLTSTLPFRAEGPTEMVHSHLARTPVAPSARAPHVPEVVSSIVMKLLSKAPEDRYQSARGLKADIDECLKQWSRTGSIEPFALGQREVPLALRVSKRLHGREAELSSILAAFDRAREGRATAVLISGHAGVGKTALGVAAKREILRRGGRFAEGACHQLRQHLPYAVLLTALRELLRHLLAEPPEAIAKWKSDLSAAVGTQGQIMVDLIPELGWLIGPQPAMPGLDHAAAQRGNALVLQSLLRALGDADRPLAIFLDDLQWIDLSSLELLSRIVTDPEGVHLLILGAYRGYEINKGLLPALDALRSHAGSVVEIALEPLDFEATKGLIAESLGAEMDETAPLAELLFERAAGNLFLLHQLLKALHGGGAITFDASQGRFRWDLDRARAAMVTESPKCRVEAQAADPETPIELARTSLDAGEKAMEAGAYPAAAGYFQAGLDALGEASAGVLDDLSVALQRGLAESEYLSGNHAAAEALFDDILSRARSTLDRAAVIERMIILLATRGDFARAVRVGKVGLALFGLVLPETEEQQKAALDALLAAVAAKLNATPLSELLDVPELTDPEQIACRSLLAKLSAPFLFVSRLLHRLDLLHHVEQSLTHGHSALSSFAFSTCSFLMVGSLGWPREAQKAWALARALDERFPDAELRCRNAVGIASAAHFFEPLSVAQAYLKRGQADARGSHDPTYLSYAHILAAMLKLLSGEELGEVKNDITESLGVLSRTQDALAMSVLELVRQAVHNLEGRTASPSTLSDDVFDEPAFLATIEGNRFSMAVGLYHTLKLVLAVIHGDHDAAIALVPKATSVAEQFGGSHYVTLVPFFAGLSLAAAIPAAPEGARERYLEELGIHQAKIATWAERCPANYRHMHLLLGAEAARVAGRGAEARELYDDAIAAAGEQSARHIEALGSELAARFYLDKGQTKLARVYMAEAQYGYMRWGATEKASDLGARYPHLLAAPARDAATPSSEMSITTAGSDSGHAIDVVAMIRAAHAIAGEIELSSLLKRLMRIVVEDAGADRGVLMLARDGQLLIEAMMTVQPEAILVGMSAPLGAGAEVPLSVVSFVERTTEPVVIGDASNAGPFAADPYLLAHPTKSVLCLGMMHQGRIIGVLYLENRATREAFTRARVELSGVLAAQAAIAVENARMVAELRQGARALSEANTALGEVNAAMQIANQRLSEELWEREQAEAARLALKEELHRVQTPIIPLTARVMVMPLVGTIDADRARQVLETALTGAQRSRAAVVILDITGVDRVDAGVAGTLVSTASALRLLGAQAVITGVRPEVAQALVALNLDLGSIVTRGTLESGVAYAMDRLKHRRL